MDWSKPYAHVYGLGCGVRYAQDGRYFYGDGSPAIDPDAPTPPPEPTPLVSTETPKDVAEPAAAAVGNQPEENTSRGKVGPDDMRLKVNQAVKEQLEAYGVEWQGLAHARAFLEGRVKE